MPAILRIFLPKSDASISYIRPYAFYDRVGVRRPGSATVTRIERTYDLQHYVLVTVLEVYAEQPIDRDARTGYDYDV